MARTGTESAIRERQLAWAEEHARIECDAAGHCVIPERNLRWLTDEMRLQVEAADGNEFGKPGERGKIGALHSSSALGLNVFGYWQGRRDAGPLEQALGAPAPIAKVKFAEQFPTGVSVPSLAVLLELKNGTLLAIESQFTEWFGHSGREPLSRQYFPKDKRLWTEAGLPGAQAAAQRHREAPQFDRLDAPQLLKQLLGLAQQKGRAKKKEWHLQLLWFREPGACAREMEEEIARFHKLLGPDGHRFSSMTYQQLWTRMSPGLAGAHADYAAYLAKRYFE
jgi:hypothetical protein